MGHVCFISMEWMDDSDVCLVVVVMMVIVMMMMDGDVRNLLPRRV